MQHDTHDTPSATTSQPNRDLLARNVTTRQNDTDGPVSGSWVIAAVNATTVRELEDIARAAQIDAEWDPRDAAWCRALRDALLAGDRAALALLRAELGATVIEERAA